jgi:hypothetical protein
MPPEIPPPSVPGRSAVKLSPRFCAGAGGMANRWQIKLNSGRGGLTLRFGRQRRDQLVQFIGHGTRFCPLFAFSGRKGHFPSKSLVLPQNPQLSRKSGRFWPQERFFGSSSDSGIHFRSSGNHFRSSARHFRSFPGCGRTFGKRFRTFPRCGRTFGNYF